MILGNLLGKNARFSHGKKIVDHDETHILYCRLRCVGLSKKSRGFRIRYHLQVQNNQILSKVL